MTTITRDALNDVDRERQRQIVEEGWSFAHDDAHDDGALARAGAAYAEYAGSSEGDAVRRDWDNRNEGVPDCWPWARKWWKPKDRRRDLVRAAALIVAEIERLDRLDLKAADAVDAAD
jgi:hypothetical protein